MIGTRSYRLARVLIFSFAIARFRTSVCLCSTTMLELNLPAGLRFRPGTSTVSGFSSGAAMAQQFHVSHSQDLQGVGIFAGVFYRCSGNTLNKTKCFEAETSVKDSINDAKKYDVLGLIDPLESLASQRVWNWIGTHDAKTAKLETRVKVIDFYQAFIPNPANIFTKIQAAYHLVPTNFVTTTCEAETKPPDKYLANCNYSGSYEMLTFIMDKDLVNPEEVCTQRSLQLEPLREFDQSEFFNGKTKDEIGIDDIGFYYVPKACKRGSANCFLHIFFHGCEVGRQRVGSEWIKKTGFLEVAEANNIVLLLPQAYTTKQNPGLCWDTWGYTGPNYANKNGPQIAAIYGMFSKLLNNS